MTEDEFKTLEPGDKITNTLSGAVGVVTSRSSDGGIYYKWEIPGVAEQPANAPTWHMPLYSTRWFNLHVVKPTGAENVDEPIN